MTRSSRETTESTGALADMGDRGDPPKRTIARIGDWSINLLDRLEGAQKRCL